LIDLSLFAGLIGVACRAMVQRGSELDGHIAAEIAFCEIGACHQVVIGIIEEIVLFVQELELYELCAMKKEWAPVAGLKDIEVVLGNAEVG